MCAPYVVKAGLTTEEDLRARRDWYLSVVAGQKERIRTYSELAPNIAYLFALSQFFMAWGLAFLYVKAAAGWDKSAAALLAKFPKK